MAADVVESIVWAFLAGMIHDWSAIHFSFIFPVQGRYWHTQDTFWYVLGIGEFISLPSI